MTTSKENQKNMMEYYRKDVEKEIADIKKGMAFNFIKHVKKFHINVKDYNLRHRIMDDKDIDVASSIIGINAKDLCIAIGDFFAQEDVTNEILEYLTWPKSDWGITDDDPDGTPYYFWMPMPEGVSGHKYERNRRHNWDDGPIECTDIQIAIIRSREYVEEKIFRSRSEYRPFIIMTAFSV